MEEPWGLLFLLLMDGGEVLPPWELALLGCEVELIPWEAWEALVDLPLLLPDWLLEGEKPFLPGN